MRFYQKIIQKLEGINSLLDIGCGDGTLDVFLAKESGIRIVGLDISPEGFSHAKKKALTDGVEDLVTCVKGSICDIFFAKDNEFEAITLIYSLHHMENPIPALKEARRVLKRGGKILIVECIAEDEEDVVCCIFNKPGLVGTLNNAGFFNTEVEILGTEDDHEFVLFEAVK